MEYMCNLKISEINVLFSVSKTKNYSHVNYLHFIKKVWNSKLGKMC